MGTISDSAVTAPIFCLSQITLHKVVRYSLLEIK